MTMTSDGESPTQRREPRTITLPPLNEATIHRAQEGLAAARNQHMRDAAKGALVNAEQLLDGGSDRKMPSAQRRLLLRIFIHLLFRVTIKYPERIPTGPVMVASNHLNHMDPFLILSTTHATPFYYILGDTRTMFNKPWKRAFVRLTGGVVPVDRMWKEEQSVVEAARAGNTEVATLASEITRDVPDGGSIETLRLMDRIVQTIFKNGDSILIFPEGGLGTQEGQLRLPLKRGTVLYAMRSGVPIVPMAISGTRDLFLRKHLIVRYGAALHFPQIDRPRPKQVQAALEELQDAIQTLLPHDYQEPKGIHLFQRMLNQMFW